MTPIGAASLRSLSEALPPSPLKAALARMAARHTPGDQGGNNKN